MFVVIISATVLKILDIKELEGIWHPKFILKMEWLDPRLDLQNLKDDMQLNVLTIEERNEPWIPIVVFNNHKDRKRLSLDEKSSLVVRKEGNGSGNSLKDIDAAEIFWASENPFVIFHRFRMLF